MSIECSEKAFTDERIFADRWALINAMKVYKSEKKAFFLPIGSIDGYEEYFGAVKSGKLLYFAFFDKKENLREKIVSFINKAKPVFELGGIVFAVICYEGRAFRVPYFILNKIPGSLFDAEKLEKYEVKTDNDGLWFLHKDVFECTVAAERIYSENV